MSLGHLGQRNTIRTDTLGLGLIGPPGTPYLKTRFDNERNYFGAKLLWREKAHTAVIGFDYSNDTAKQKTQNGLTFHFQETSPGRTDRFQLDKWALYLNDTILIGKWSITPGIRIDHNTLDDTFVSPSLGLTYRLCQETLLRAAASRGFTHIPGAQSTGGGLFLSENPDLEPERVWSFQVGMESMALTYFRLKATAYQHQIKNALRQEISGNTPTSYQTEYTNEGSETRQGVEIELETVPLYGITIQAGATYIHNKPATVYGQTDLYSCDIIFRYENRDTFWAEMAGHYDGWDLGKMWQLDNDFLWDLNLVQTIKASDRIPLELFFTIHNLFNGSQYFEKAYANPKRWIEVGLRISF